MVRDFVKYLCKGCQLESAYTGTIYRFLRQEGPDCVLAYKQDHSSPLVEDDIVILNIKDVTPADTVKFLSADGAILFEAKNLTNVMFNGKVRRVVYLDYCSFKFVTGPAYNLCEFAEQYNKNGSSVKPIQQNLLPMLERKCIP